MGAREARTGIAAVKLREEFYRRQMGQRFGAILSMPKGDSDTLRRAEADAADLVANWVRVLAVVLTEKKEGRL